MDRSLLTKGRVEVSVPAESRRKVSNMHGYAIRAIPRGAKVERIKSRLKKKEKTNDERETGRKRRKNVSREAVEFIFIRRTKGPRNFSSPYKSNFWLTIRTRLLLFVSSFVLDIIANV